MKDEAKPLIKSYSKSQEILGAHSRNTPQSAKSVTKKQKMPRKENFPIKSEQILQKPINFQLNRITTETNRNKFIEQEAEEGGPEADSHSRRHSLSGR